MQRRYIRIRELASVPGRDGLLPVAPATVWRWVKLGTFPQPVRLSGGVTAWPAEAVEAWQQQAGERGADGFDRWGCHRVSRRARGWGGGPE